jgi:CRP/FNR family transcriptional regulator, cyclic AMP receptor protein
MPFWIDTIGYVGSFLAVLTYWMKDMLSLRIAALSACVFFIAYAAMIGSWPLLAMEFVLLPINAFRLLELRRAPPASRSASTISSHN